MSDERVKPTAGGMCSSACPSYVAEAGYCSVCGHQKTPVEMKAYLKPAYECQPYWEAIQDAYQASRNKAPVQDYCVVRLSKFDALITRVMDLQQDGWRTSGGVSVDRSEPPLYMQAMVRDAPAKQTVDFETPAGWVTVKVDETE